MNLFSPELWNIFRPVSDFVACNCELIIRTYFIVLFTGIMLIVASFFKPQLFGNWFCFRWESKVNHLTPLVSMAKLALNPKHWSLKKLEQWTASKISINGIIVQHRQRCRSLVSRKCKNPHSFNVCNKPNITWLWTSADFTFLQKLAGMIMATYEWVVYTSWSWIVVVVTLVNVIIIFIIITIALFYRLCVCVFVYFFCLCLF